MLDGVVRVGQKPSSPTEEIAKWLGTGFFIERNGKACLVATAKHVVAKADSSRLAVQFFFYDEKPVQAAARIKRAVDNKDLAFLEIESSACSLPKLHIFPLLESLTDRVKRNDGIYAIGFFSGPRFNEPIEPIIRNGTIEAFDLIPLEGVEGKAFLLKMESFHGHSGGPIILKNTGHAVGVIKGGLGKSPYVVATPITLEDLTVKGQQQGNPR